MTAHELPPIARLRQPSAADRAALFAYPSRPAIIDGVVERWPAARWTWEHLTDAAADHEVDASVAGAGKSFTVRSRTERIRLSDHVRAVVAGEGPPTHYIGATPLAAIPALVGDVDFAQVVGRQRFSGPNLWIGVDGTRSGLHYDATHGCMAMIRGRKRVALFPPDTPFDQIYPHPISSRAPNWSRVADVSRIDDPSFPGFRRAPRLEVLLEEGEILFIPVHWWHAVQGVGANVGVNVWFQAPLRHYVASRFAARSLAHEVLKRSRWLNRLRRVPAEL